MTQAEKEALKLLEAHGGDRDIVLASVWIHDRYKPLFYGLEHGNKAADWAVENLEGKGFPEEKVKAVEYAVRNHQGWTTVGLDTLEAQIVWDADKVAHLGPSFFLGDILLFTSKYMCENVFPFKIKYEPTFSLENILPVLMEWKKDDDVYEVPPDLYYLDETKKIHVEKSKAVNAFLDALLKGL